MKEHTEGYFKAKEIVNAIQDIDCLLESYDYAFKEEESCEKIHSLNTIFNYIRYIFNGKKRECLYYVDAKSQFSCEFMVDLHEFLVEERKKFEKKLQILE